VPRAGPGLERDFLSFGYVVRTEDFVNMENIGASIGYKHVLTGGFEDRLMRIALDLRAIRSRAGLSKGVLEHVGGFANRSPRGERVD
jgi:hypothetical protein